MSDHERLVHSSPNAFTRQLLEAGLRDRPATGSFEVVATGLGLGAAGAITSKVAGLQAAEGASSAMPNATVAEPLASAAGSGALGAAPATLAASAVKWLAIGLVAGGVASGGGVAVQRALRNEPRPVAAARPPRAPAPSEPRTVRLDGEPPAGQLAPAVSGLLEAAPRQPAAASVRRAGSAAPAGSAASEGPSARAGTEGAHSPDNGARADGALAREAAWIDAARRALDHGELARATSALDDYDRERRVGVLNREALVLRVEVALQQRDFSRARVLTERLAASYPGDPHVARLRARSTPSASQ